MLKSFIDSCLGHGVLYSRHLSRTLGFISLRVPKNPMMRLAGMFGEGDDEDDDVMEEDI